MKSRLNSAKAEAQALSLSLAEFGNTRMCCHSFQHMGYLGYVCLRVCWGGEVVAGIANMYILHRNNNKRGNTRMLKHSFRIQDFRCGKKNTSRSWNTERSQKI